MRKRKCSIDLRLLIEETFLSDYYECESSVYPESKRIKLLENSKLDCNNSGVGTDSSDICSEENYESENTDNVYSSANDSYEFRAG